METGKSKQAQNQPFVFKDDQAIWAKGLQDASEMKTGKCFEKHNNWWVNSLNRTEDQS